MSNTTTKVNNYIALGYLFLASEKPVERSVEPASEDTANETPISVNYTENESILPINNQVIRTLNFSTNSSSLRI